MELDGKVRLVKIGVLALAGVVGFAVLQLMDTPADVVVGWIAAFAGMVGIVALGTASRRRGVPETRRAIYSIGIASMAALIAWVATHG